MVHVNDLAYHNFLDGFSFEGNAPGCQVHNCVATENGEYDLWVDSTSAVSFVSDYNLFWTSTATVAPVKYISTKYATVALYQAASGQDAHTKSADPKFTSAATADFRLMAGSPAIDCAMSSAANWPATDASGGARMDDSRTANTGVGPVTYADLGPLEFIPPLVDHAPVVIAPGTVKTTLTQNVSFTITASDSDGDAITSLTMVAVKMPAGNTGDVHAECEQDRRHVHVERPAAGWHLAGEVRGHEQPHRIGHDLHPGQEGPHRRRVLRAGRAGNVRAVPEPLVARGVLRTRPAAGLRRRPERLRHAGPARLLGVAFAPGGPLVRELGAVSTSTGSAWGRGCTSSAPRSAAW
jgi:hypothetical protein